MQRTSEPLAPVDDEARSELTRAQAELEAARRTVSRLEEDVAARTQDVALWTERALDGPPPPVHSWLSVFLLGLFLGAGLCVLYVVIAGGVLPPL